MKHNTLVLNKNIIKGHVQNFSDGCKIRRTQFLKNIFLMVIFYAPSHYLLLPLITFFL